MFEWIEVLLRRRYVRRLEEENARLRAENRALINSLLGTAGIAPVEFDAPQSAAAMEIPRVRRRSWQQFARRKEIEAAGIERAVGAQHVAPLRQYDEG